MKKLFIILCAVSLLVSCAKDTGIQYEVAAKKGGNGNGNGGNGNGNQAVLADTIFADWSGVLYLANVPPLPPAFLRLSWNAATSEAIESVTISKEVNHSGVYTDVFTQSPGIAISFWDETIGNGVQVGTHYKLRGVTVGGNLIVGNPNPLIGLQ